MALTPAIAARLRQVAAGPVEAYGLDHTWNRMRHAGLVHVPAFRPGRRKQTFVITSAGAAAFARLDAAPAPERPR